jgi:hypothetical protein
MQSWHQDPLAIRNGDLNPRSLDLMPLAAKLPKPFGTSRYQEPAHNHCVKRLLAAAMLTLFASLNAIDGICCPDGCTHDPPSTSQHQERQSSDGTCVLCAGGVESSVVPSPLPSAIVTSPIALPHFTRRLDAPADPPDHPPRS